MSNYKVTKIIKDKRLRNNHYVYEIKDKDNNNLYVDLFFFYVDRNTFNISGLVEEDEVIDTILAINPDAYIYLPDSYKTIKRSINAVKYNEENIKYVPKELLYTLMSNVKFENKSLEASSTKRLVEYNLKLLKEFIEKDYEILTEKINNRGFLLPEGFFDKDKEKDYKRLSLKIKKMFIPNI